MGEGGYTALPQLPLWEGFQNSPRAGRLVWLGDARESERQVSLCVLPAAGQGGVGGPRQLGWRRCPPRSVPVSQHKQRGVGTDAAVTW